MRLEIEKLCKKPKSGLVVSAIRVAISSGPDFGFSKGRQMLLQGGSVLRVDFLDRLNPGLVVGPRFVRGIWWCLQDFGRGVRK